MTDRYIVSNRKVADRSRPDVMLLALLTLATVLFLLNTRHGIGILPDSTRYMQLVSTPYDAPLYPWLLDAGSLLGFDIVDVAHVLAFVLYGVNTVLVYRLFVHAIGRQPTLVIIGTLLVIVHPAFLWLNTVAMSEPVFFALSIMAVRSFVAYMVREDRRLLASSSVFLGLAMLARFVAAPLGASFAAVMLLCSPRRNIGRRLADIGLLFVVSAGIFFCWAVINKLMVGRALGRALWFYGNADAERWLGGLSVLASFILPSQIPDAIRIPLLLAVIIVALIAVAWTARRNWLNPKPALSDLYILIFGFFSVFYVAFVVLSVFIEANLQLNTRYSIVLYFSLVILLVISAAQVLDGVNPAPTLKWLIVAPFVALLAFSVIRSAARTKEAYDEGIGYQSVAWQSSPIVTAVRALPENAIIFSNACDPLNFLTRRWTEWTPMRSERRTGLEDEGAAFEEEMQNFRQALAKPDAYVVFADAIDWRFYMVSEDELVRLAELELIKSESDGRIYRARSTGEQSAR